MCYRNSTCLFVSYGGDGYVCVCDSYINVCVYRRYGVPFHIFYSPNFSSFVFVYPESFSPDKMPYTHSIFYFVQLSFGTVSSSSQQWTVQLRAEFGHKQKLPNTLLNVRFSVFLVVGRVLGGLFAMQMVFWTVMRGKKYLWNQCSEQRLNLEMTFFFQKVWRVVAASISHRWIDFPVQFRLNTGTHQKRICIRMCFFFF